MVDLEDFKKWPTWTYDNLREKYEKIYKNGDDSAGVLLNARLQYHQKTKSCRPREEIYIEGNAQSLFKEIDKLLKRLLNDESFDNYKDVVNEQSVPMRKKHVLIWSVIINRRDYVTRILKEQEIETETEEDKRKEKRALGGKNIYGALFASAMFKFLSKLAEAEENVELAESFMDNSTDFELLACNGIAHMYLNHRKMSQTLLTQTVDEYGGSMKTVMEFAANNELMMFMGTSACQTKLKSVWRKNMSIFTSREMILTCIALPVCIPFIKFVAYENVEKNKPFLDKRCCCTKHKEDSIVLYDTFRRFYSAPVTKFWTNLISYIMMLCCFSFFVLTDLHPVSDGQISSMESFVLFWILTLLIEEFRQIGQKKQRSLWHKIRSWWTNAWNKFDAIMYILFLLSVILRVSLSDDYFIWARMMYTITLGIFILRTLNFFYVAKNTGPKIIMIGNMVTDIQFFVMIFSVVLVSFGTITQANLFPNSEPTWQLLKNVVYMPYWQMYSELYLETIEGQETSTCTTVASIYRNGTLPRCPESTALVPIVLAIYMVLTHIMLMNLLIAMFSNTFQKVQDNSVLIWKFYRYSLVNEYYERPVLVPPFIILNHIYWMIQFFIYKACDKCKKNRNAFEQPITTDDSKQIAKYEREAIEVCCQEFDGRHNFAVSRKESCVKKPYKITDRDSKLNEIEALCKQMNSKLAELMKDK